MTKTKSVCSCNGVLCSPESADSFERAPAQTYVCAGCLCTIPWCIGGTDSELCDDCWDTSQ